MQSTNCTAFISLMLQKGGGTNNTHGSLVTTEHMWNPLCTNVSFPQGADGDTVNTCWRDSDFCTNCHAWTTACTFKDDFTCSIWRSSVTNAGAPQQEASSLSSWSLLMAFAHQWTVSHEGAYVPKPFFNDSQHSSIILPHKTWNVINVLMSGGTSL